MSPSISAEDKLDYVKSKIGEYPNFPKEGILFRWVIVTRGYQIGVLIVLRWWLWGKQMDPYQVVNV